MRQLVELFKLIYAGDYEDMKNEGNYLFYRVGITPKGKRALESLRCDEREVLAGVYARLPAHQRPKVVKALEALRTCLERPEGAAAACCPPAAVRRAAA